MNSFRMLAILIVFCSFPVSAQNIDSPAASFEQATDLVDLFREAKANGEGIPAILSEGCDTAPTDEEYLQSLAEEGDPGAQFSLAFRFLYKKNFTEAIKWFRKSAEGSYALSENIIGLAYANDILTADPFGRDSDIEIAKKSGYTVDYQEAAKWFLLAANQGNRTSSYFLGILHRDGLGRKQDIEEAYFWFRVATGGFKERFPGLIENLEKQLTSEQIARQDNRIKKWKPNHTELKNLKPQVNVRGLLCGKSKGGGAGCEASDMCGDIVGLDCGSGGDGPYFFAERKTGEIMGACSYWQGKCIPPTEWKCGRPKHYAG